LRQHFYLIVDNNIIPISLALNNCFNSEAFLSIPVKNLILTKRMLQFAGGQLAESIETGAVLPQLNVATATAAAHGAAGGHHPIDRYCCAPGNQLLRP